MTTIFIYMGFITLTMIMVYLLGFFMVPEDDHKTTWIDHILTFILGLLFILAFLLICSSIFATLYFIVWGIKMLFI